MYFITGGSFNGKSRWVRNHFRLKNSHTEWVSLFNEGLGELQPSLPIVVLEGLEYAVRSALLHKNDDVRTAFKNRIQSLRKWEEEDPERKVIWIGSEIGKGIVPIDQSSREWRDMTGWIYQDLSELSERVWLVWYGLATSLKG
ncbi:bifunctional adenosylcobinamide kinase/adenosylcobinamide-phosphate guanylyltransferase [Rossellomorea arthrocnemi]|jgi:adenosylcobinamide kinase / adenosylcobinamide-phosphate guanylyltransferase|uniref:bifunctional adenosylcobinamide kinase/adenosylcobinamide-phosphate guanylyltransferase n=1 Tax=Rossellomorea arthrocnemi TaxID=2769542 RepID=UPI0019184137|nr:bifunctional adenosylcobinamide kinase/adenosylcobinamide-phosphate guanylyltransferase [Rossellomorea arthrocnemi]